MTSKEKFIVVTTEDGKNVKVKLISAQGHHKEAFVEICRNLLGRTIVYDSTSDWNVALRTGKVYDLQILPVITPDAGGSVRGLYVEPTDPTIVAQLVLIRKVIGVIVDEPDDSQEDV